jgi:hypothetical protein
MKSLKEIIIEKLKIGSKTKISNNQCQYFPKDKEELSKLLDQLIKERGLEANLNDIDTSNIINMAGLFKMSKFDGNISEWNVSNVKNMNAMFAYSCFSGKNGNISNWNTDKVKTMQYIFYNCPLEKNPPKWYHE